MVQLFICACMHKGFFVFKCKYVADARPRLHDPHCIQTWVPKIALHVSFRSVFNWNNSIIICEAFESSELKLTFCFSNVPCKVVKKCVSVCCFISFSFCLCLCYFSLTVSVSVSLFFFFSDCINSVSLLVKVAF